MISLNATNGVIALALLTSLSFQNPTPPPFPPNSPEDYVISREVNLVVLPITVSNREGQFVSGLEKSDFRVYENGQPQTITDFRSEDTPVTVGLVVDHSGSMIAKSKEVIEGAIAFVQESNPQDEEFIVNFTDKIVMGLPANVAFTSDANDLKAALSTPSASGRTALNDAVIVALRHLDLHQGSKKVIILISDGGDNASYHTSAQALRIALSTNVVIYTIGLFDEDSADQNPKALQLLAKETGGLAYFPRTSADMVRVCRQIAGDIRHQYTIAYSPAKQGTNTYLKIRVNVITNDRRKLDVRTRAGYYWPSRTATVSGGSAGARQ
jgi:Ca-activated chloride channel family protein